MGIEMTRANKQRIAGRNGMWPVSAEVGDLEIKPGTRSPPE
jgi:hypothetical protein